MAGSGKIPPEVLNLHTEMVNQLSEIFSLTSSSWQTICEQIFMLEFLPESHRGKEPMRMEELFTKLKMKGVIKYGNYKNIRNILSKENIDAGTIIDDYTKRINEAFNKMGKPQTGRDSDSKTEEDGSKSKRREGKRYPSPDSDSNTGDDEPKAKQMKGKRHPSPDSDSNTGDDEPKAEQMKGHHKGSTDSNFGDVAWENKIKHTKEEPGNFRTLHDYTHDARKVFTWQKAMDAVGYIKGPVSSGTGFRVGNDKVLTAYHVVEDVTKMVIDGKPDLSKLGQDVVSITFNFLMNDVSTDKKMPNGRAKETYYFEKHFSHDKKLDFAVLTLRNKNTSKPPSYPNPITLFKNPGETFAIIGHPGGKHMQLDPKVQIFDPHTQEGRNRGQTMKKWARQKGQRAASAYEGVLDTKDADKVLFDCWVQHGASGSPGIEMNSNGEPVCSLMILRGLPYFVFDKGYTIKKEDHPYMIEQGVTMKAIAETISGWGPEGEKIKQEIFADNKFE